MPNNLKKGMQGFPSLIDIHFISSDCTPCSRSYMNRSQSCVLSEFGAVSSTICDLLSPVLQKSITDNLQAKLFVFTIITINDDNDDEVLVFDISFSFQRPSLLEGFTQPISNDRGHILPGIPRSSKSPWGEFVGTWDTTRPPLKTKTMKTNAKASNAGNTVVAETTGKERTPSPKQDVTEKAKSPAPELEAVRTPREEAKSPRPTSQENQNENPPTPTKLKTPEIAASPAKSPIQEIQPAHSPLPDPS